MKTFIALKKLWYGEPLAVEPTQATIATIIEKMTEVKNVHQDTWGYEEADPEQTEYVNELTGQNYYVDVTKLGIPTISFTLGDYDYQQKADLQGGSVIKDEAGTEEIGWKKPVELNAIYKSVIALSKTGVYIVLTNAQITGKGDVQEKNIGLGVQALACENNNAGVSSEYWFKAPADK